MTTEGIVAIIGAITAGIVAIIGAVALAYRQAAAAKEAALHAETLAEATHKEVVETRTGVFEVGKQLDGRLSELLLEARRTAKAEGVLEGEQKQRDRAAPSDSGK